MVDSLREEDVQGENEDAPTGLQPDGAVDSRSLNCQSGDEAGATFVVFAGFIKFQ